MKLLTTERLASIVRPTNVFSLCVVPLILLLVWPQNGPVTPLVLGAGPETLRRIGTLEEELRRRPGDVLAATEIGRIWQSVGQLPWAYSALYEAERDGPKDAASRLRLAAAYLDLGELDDCRRNLAAAREACKRSPCAEPVSFKLSLFTRLTDNLVRDGIVPRRDLAYLEQAYLKLIREMAGALPGPKKPDGSKP